MKEIKDRDKVMLVKGMYGEEVSKIGIYIERHDIIVFDNPLEKGQSWAIKSNNYPAKQYPELIGKYCYKWVASSCEIKLATIPNTKLGRKLNPDCEISEDGKWILL